MESQAVHSHGHGYEHDPNTGGLHSVVEGEDHHEKKSVLKKVKAKAKKLKDTITKHGHNHDHDRHEGHIPDDHDLDEEDEEAEDEEVVEDPDIHGAPMYESAAMRSAVPGLGLERPTGTEEAQNLAFHTSQEHAAGVIKAGHDRPRAEYGGTMPIDEGLRTPANTPQSPVPTHGTATRAADPARTFLHETADQSKVNLTRPGRLEEDPDAPKDREELYKPSNYQTKVTDPTGSGGDEVKIAPVDQAFGAMHIRDETETKPNQIPTTLMGSHDQFSPESITKETEKLSASREPVCESHSAAGIYEGPLKDEKPVQIPSASTGSHDQFSPGPITKDTEKLSASQEPVHESHSAAGTEGTQKDEKPSSPSSYTEKISSATAAVADKAIAAKNILTSKLGYGTSPEGDVKEDKSPGKSPRQGGYAEKITSATHVIADKAVSAKNLVTSKIGYGQKEDQAAHESSGVTEHPADKTSEQSSYTGKIAAVGVTARDVVASKLGYGKKDDAASHEKTEQMIGEGYAGGTTSATEHRKKGSVQDKGVSVKDYLAEKLKPGEEDKALSEVISSALDKRKKTADKPAVVTESDEVRRHLGEGQLSSPGKGVVDKLKGAVGSWLGKSGDPNAPQQSHGTDAAREEQGDERRLQESMG
ncbi:low-temperature-induced 65 kDa protein-like isoform X2 [Punica granatum]|uniref:Low-temperature-induced 65 kDa protein-like isoform X2 n=1 Tax=Punica granatum TaxID=22663 RepID=A0A6P8DHI3_PUNGR|nr:low-temperature-induced 65 kDa protein-like isoform X2 [Punica granatum]